jgi:hypothetical protein
MSDISLTHHLAKQYVIVSCYSEGILLQIFLYTVDSGWSAAIPFVFNCVAFCLQGLPIRK